MSEPIVDAWRQTTRDVLDLLETVPDDAWDRPTVLPGWTVRDVTAHLAHLEAVLAGLDVAVHPNASPDHVAPDYTQAGVDARRARPPSVLVAELRRAVEARTAELEAGVVEVGPDRVPGGIESDTSDVWFRRVVDLWTHEQDLREALERPGGEDSPGAQATVRGLAGALPFVLGRKAGAPVGTTVRWTLTGPIPLGLTATVGADGRARWIDDDTVPTVELVMTSTVFARLLTGRADAGVTDVEVHGDRQLGERIVLAMNILF